MQCSKSWLLLSLLVVLATADKARYDQYRVYRILPETDEHLNCLHELKESGSQVSFWNDIRKVNKPVDIMVAPHLRPFMEQFVSDHALPSKVVIKNVQELIDDEEDKRRNLSKKLEWTNYYPLEDINAWLDDQVANNENVSLVIGGSTYEKREIRGIEIRNGDDLPGVIIESGIHAREWIGPAASSWIADKIINSPAGSIWRQFNYIYFPSVNPDGYVYTHTEDRMWRKTRKPYKALGGLITCYGADPNRNYGYHWMEGGASSNPCADDFAGPSAFSEIESKSLADFLRSVSKNHPIHLAVHSYSQLLMFPWGYTPEHAPQHNTWQRIGDLAAAALTKVHGTEFDVGNIYDTIYQTSGTSTEWYYGEFEAPITYTFELRDTGVHGFILPPDQIIPVAEELIAAFQVILEEYLKL